MKRFKHWNRKAHFNMWERTNHAKSHSQYARSDEATYDPLSVRLREILQESRKTIYQVSADTGIDGAYIWRIVRGERVEVSREVLMLLSMAMILDKSSVDQVIEMANRLLDAGGYKVLRGR